MKKLTTKISVDGNKTTIEVFEDKRKVDAHFYYANICGFCRKETLDKTDFGNDYICPSCSEYLSKRFAKHVVEEPKIEVEEKKPKKSLKGYKIKNRIYVALKDYSPDIKILNFMDYANLMDSYKNKVTEKMCTILVELILKDCNTINKIFKELKVYNIETLYHYLCKMSRVGMLYRPEQEARESKYDTIYKVHKNLLYTAI